MLAFLLTLTAPLSGNREGGSTAKLGESIVGLLSGIHRDSHPKVKLLSILKCCTHLTLPE